MERLIEEQDIPTLVERLRERMGLTQEKFAQEVVVTFSTVNLWENGHRRPQPYLQKRLLKMKEELDADSTRSAKRKPSG